MEKSNFQLTQDIVKDLRCSLCEQFLSVPPISLISDNGKKYKCGRCHVICTHIETRCYMYEALAKHMMFPCTFEGCNEMLSWSDVKGHEKDCIHYKIICPKLDCNVKIGTKDFSQHFKKYHKESYHEDRLTVSNVNNYFSLDLLLKDGKVYIVLFDYNDAFYGVNVCSLEPDNHQFELIIDSNSTRRSMVITEQKIVPFDDKTHCFKCISGVCKSEFHRFRYYKNGILKRMTTKIDKYTITEMFKSRPLNYNLNIVEEKPETDELDDLVKDMVVDEVNDDEEEEYVVSNEEKVVRKLLSCPICSQYMQAPIHQCTTGHTICDKCKTTSEKCPTCQAGFDGTRNYILEDLSGSLRLPSDGNAESEVEDKEIMCPMLHCFDKFNLKTIGSHFKNKHIDHYHWNSVTVKNVYSYVNVHVIETSSRTYLVFFDYNSESFVLNVCCLSKPDDSRCEVKLARHDGKLGIVATNQKVIPFDDTNYCCKCNRGACVDVKHKNSSYPHVLAKSFTTRFDKRSTMFFLLDNKLDYVVEILDPRRVFQKDLQRKKDKVFRQLYECPICKDYMLPPIHQCAAGHVLCNTCKDKVEKCPSCEGSYNGTRNYILEEVVENVVLPCQFVSQNCPFRAGVKRMASHESVCPLNSKKICGEPSKKEEGVKETV